MIILVLSAILKINTYEAIKIIKREEEKGDLWSNRESN